MKNDKDAQFLCKDCAGFGQCEYYDRRKEDSYICKYFRLTDTYGMTNGDVLKILFPNCKANIIDGWVSTNIDKFTAFSIEWWNAPYKKGGEE